MVHQKENQEVWFLKYLEVNNMIPNDTIPNIQPIANIAGYWSLGIFKGVVTVIIPIAIFSMSAGFIGKVIRKSGKIGGSN